MKPRWRDGPGERRWKARVATETHRDAERVRQLVDGLFRSAPVWKVAVDALAAGIIADVRSNGRQVNE